jgi:PAS domain S-box-containing protein
MAMTISPEILAARILVVDDRDTDRRLVLGMLEGSGFSRVSSSGDPRGVAALHRANRYDLIILDLLMPGMDGFQVMESLKELEPHGYLPVLAVTADPDLMSRALEAGARDHVNKPLRRDELVSRVRNLVQVSMLVREKHEHADRLQRSLEESTERLWEQAELFRMFANNVPEGIVIRGVDDRVIRYANPAWTQITGRELTAGTPIDEAIDAVHPLDRDFVREQIRKYPNGGTNVEVRYQRPDGAVRWSQVRTFAIRDSGGKPLWVCGILQDITELRESESRYRALVEQSIVGIYIVEAGKFTYANPRMCEMLGYTLEELRGIETADLVVEEDRERLAANRARRDAGDSRALAATYRLRHRNGRVLHFAVDGRILEEGGRQLLFGIGQDVTDRIQAQEALAEADLQLRDNEERYRQRLLDVQEEERRGISLELHDDVGQLLVALKIGLHRVGLGLDEGKATLVRECVEVTDLVREKVREVATQLHPPQLEQLGLQDALRGLVHRQRDLTGIAIRYSFEGLDRHRLAGGLEGACYRICQEALSNATRHAQANVIDVKLAGGNGWVTLEVADDGVGFDKASGREEILRTGSLGLISMEERARLAGGSLEIRTGPGSGTRVSATFPT